MAVFFDAILRKLREGGAVGGAMALEGQWNATTNTPDISGTTSTGSFWIVSVAGSTDVGGITDWKVSDWVVKTTTGWMKVDNSDVGDMLKSTYDPTTVNGDAFDMDNMVEGDTKLILSSTERTNIANSVTHAGLTTTAHGGIIASNDARLTDARTPTAHAGTHATGQSDAIAAGDIGAEVSGAAATVQGNLNTHTGLTTTAHGGIVASNDARLTDARTPTAHAGTHAAGQADEVTVTKTQVGLSNVDNVQQMPLSYLDTDNTLAADSDVKVPSQKAIKAYVTKANVGLSNVDNVQQMPLSYLDTDTTLAADSDTKVPSQKAIKTYRDALITNINEGRLTLESGVPVSTTNQTAKTTLYYTPYNGNKESVYSGTAWKILTFTEISLDISSYTAGLPYDIFEYDNSGTLTLEGLAWSNTTTRATALTTQDGVYVKSGDATRKYKGSICITAVTGECEDSTSKRFVWNAYNRVPRGGQSVNANASWAYTTAVTREFNAGTGQTRFEFILGLAGLSNLTTKMSYTVTGNTATVYIGIAIDATDALNYSYQKFASGSYLSSAVNANSGIGSAIGYHYMTQVEYGGANATVYGSGNPAVFTLPM